MNQRSWNALLAIVIAASLVTQIVLLVFQGTDVTTGAESETVSVATRLSGSSATSPSKATCWYSPRRSRWSRIQIAMAHRGECCDWAHY
jgi:hypothetical protein